MSEQISKEGAVFITLMISVVVCMMVAIAFHGCGYEQGFRGGQIDALTGHAHYHLVTKPDSTKVWEEMK